MTDLRIVTESASRFADYARVPIAFRVSERFVVEPTDPAAGGAAPAALRLERQDPVYEKDYDAIDGCHPAEWPARHDVLRWWVAAAFAGARRVGGAVVALDPALVSFPDSRDDAAVLWDLRVSPDDRRRGIGAQLFRAAAEHARRGGRTRLLIETQNTNVAACRFYAAQGCKLIAFDPAAYPAFPEEVRLIWSMALGRHS